MRVIGTAGHVDHGKSTLVRALSGINPDRLKEEQAREMTIELGFAWMNLPDGEPVGIVDVPGHRDFIENMLAGVGGIDAALFVVAADEGVMPQTREHLAILDILQIPAGIIALTKCDLVHDPEWLDLIEADVRKAVQGTVLDKVPLVRVSARTGLGLEELKQKLAVVLEQRPARPDLGRPRLPIDRVFTISGFGTVVTGTLVDGGLKLGEEIEILPQGLRGRVRGLQGHKKKEEMALPGSRTAVNITGIDVDRVNRGNVLITPGKYTPTGRLDAWVRLLPDASSSLKHDSEVKLFVLASEVVARLRLLGTDELKPGEEGWLQLELRDPVVAVRGDRYILRRPSPGETLGGGLIVDPHPAGRHKRFDLQVLERLESLRQGSPAEVLFQASLASGPTSVKEIITRARLSTDQAVVALQELLANNLLVQLEPGSPGPASELLVVAAARWETETARSLAEVEQFHKTYPFRKGMPREELKSRLKYFPARLFTAALKLWVSAGKLAEIGALVLLPGFKPRFNPQQQAQVDRLLARFAQNPYATPSVKECQAEIGEEIYNALLDQGFLAQVSPEVVFRKQDYETMVQSAQESIQKNAAITVAEFRDMFNTSRKYALALLEHLDRIGVTIREGDFRKLKG
ncbi:MAG TPA: selenocysteine-specific translation elongation factor [Anaerolineaceae bacterium]